MASGYDNMIALVGAQNVSPLFHRGRWYLLVTGTGERSFGADGGELCFAYGSSDVRGAGAPRPGESYADWCARGPAPHATRALAILCARRGLRLAHAGSCEGVLTAVEYKRFFQRAQRARNEA